MCARISIFASGSWPSSTSLIRHNVEGYNMKAISIQTERNNRPNTPCTSCGGPADYISQGVDKAGEQPLADLGPWFHCQACREVSRDEITGWLSRRGYTVMGAPVHHRNLRRDYGSRMLPNSAKTTQPASSATIPRLSGRRSSIVTIPMLRQGPALMTTAHGIAWRRAPPCLGRVPRVGVRAGARFAGDSLAVCRRRRGHRRSRRVLLGGACTVGRWAHHGRVRTWPTYPPPLGASLTSLCEFAGYGN